MKLIFSLAITVLSTHVIFAQGHGFPFGKTSYDDLDIKVYPKDTAAVAVVLNEFAEAYINDERDFHLFFEYHVKIKILKQEGVKQADIEIPLYKQDSRTETISGLKASSFNYENGSMKEVKLDQKSMYPVKMNASWDVMKFAIPNVRVGSVIEIQYIVESPFIYNFHNWEFQSDIPKVISEYWASIPAVYKFNITIRGFLSLDKNEAEVMRECVVLGSGKADCTRYKWAIKNIPAFKEEEYMTAKSNFISMIKFELSEINYFDGRKDRITKEWKDAEQELRTNEKFGLQLKRGKSIVDEHVELLLAGETDPLIKAKKIYDFIRNWYHWDNKYGKYSELGIKKAFDTKAGNVGDINLTLIAALKYGDIDTEPLLLSTRENGLPTEVHPVLSDFNYVIAKVNIGEKVYLLDATDRFVPFAMIPERCINGKGRVLGEKESYWHELKATDKSRSVSMMTVKLDKKGVLTGKLQITYNGYEAVSRRKAIENAGGKGPYIKDFTGKLDGISITGFAIENENDLNSPLRFNLDIHLNGFENADAAHFLFNPFLLDRWDGNPFKSSERFYPVDFGSPLEQTFILSMEYPETFEVVDLPQKVALALPNAGGRYLFEVRTTGTTLSMNNALQISRPVFTSNEYHFLKELFARVVANQQTELYFRKKS